MFFNEDLIFGNDHAEIYVEETNLGLEPDMSGCYRIIAEGTEEWYILREKMMRLEHDAIVNENTALLSEGQVGFFKRIADFFRGLWAKIKELWTKFTSWLAGKVLSDKTFVKKYEAVLRNKNIGKFSYTGWKWNIKGGINIPGAVDAELKEVANKILSNSSEKSAEEYEEAKREETYDNFRAKIIKGAGSKVTAENFEKTMKKIIRGGEEKTPGLKPDIMEMINTIKNAEESLKKIKEDKNAMDKMYNKVIAHFETAANDLAKIAPEDEKLSYTGTDRDDSWGTGKTISSNVKRGNDAKRKAAVIYANAQATKARKYSQIINQAFGIKMNAVREQRNEYRSVLAKVVAYNPELNDSYDFFSESTSVLDMY